MSERSTMAGGSMRGSHPKSAGEAPTALQHTTAPWGFQHCQEPTDGGLDSAWVRSASGCLPHKSSA